MTPDEFVFALHGDLLSDHTLIVSIKRVLLLEILKPVGITLRQNQSLSVIDRCTLESL